MIELYQGDCLEVMRGMEENSVSAIVTDPPYGLSFMGKKWDYEVPSVEIWKEALRVLKPGGTALIFAGSRTQHRMAVNIEDAGFILKDCIMWIYGSGFPKSTDISKQIDKKAGAEREVIGQADRYRDGKIRENKGDNSVNVKINNNTNGVANITKPATPAAQLWNGYGTALKPAYEPIIVAMKPNDGTFANNALKHGVAGINIDGCRVGTDDKLSFGSRELGDGLKYGKCKPSTEGIQNNKGRFPANIIHDGSEDVLGLFPDKAGAAAPVMGTEQSNLVKNAYGERERVKGAFHNDSGSAARFFYCAKASKSERGEGNNHPTVKPLSLCRYLIRLVKMPGETIVLDNFMGSGTFGKAAKLEGVSFVGIEKDLEYFKIAERRIDLTEHQLTF